VGLLHAAPSRLKSSAATVRNYLHRALASVGLRQSESRISGDAQNYWTDTNPERWKSDSHWRDANVFSANDLWSSIGARHLEMFERGVRLVGGNRSVDRIIEWGCGGGANAIAFAPLARQFFGVDVAPETLQECEKQVAEVCATTFVPVLIPVDDPEHALSLIDGPCDVFLSFYVFELIPSPEYGARLLKIASQLLAPGGLALIQIRYDEGRWSTRPHRRAYRSGLADMTTYPIAAFWKLAEDCGLKPESIELVPKNELDERYAYFLLTKPA
jgi:SAM-dependent methyltransferase